MIAVLLGQQTGQPVPLPAPYVDWSVIAPEIAFFVAALVIVAGMAVSHRWPLVRDHSLFVALAGVAVAAVFLVRTWGQVVDHGPFQAVAGTVAVDGLSVFLRSLIVAVTLLALLVAHGFLRREHLDAGAYHALLLLSASGMLMMASANDLVVVFLALEVLSIALYVLSAYNTAREESREAGIKYFVLGAFSSAIFLYGIAFVYGATGTTNLTGIVRFLGTNTLLDHAGLLVGIVLMLVGLGFKISAVPFHMWTPDVYQGAPSPVVAFQAAGTKVAAFAAILRVFVSALETQRVDWQPLLWVLAVLTMVVGCVIGIVQQNVKRMMAYSSISHAGFILIGVQTASERGVSAALSYLLAYSFLVVGTFGVITVVSRRGDTGHDLDDYRGLASAHPVLAGTLTLFLLGQLGLPLTSGFVAKLSVFSAAVDDRQYGLVIIGVFASAVAAFIYLRIMVAMYLSGDGEPRAIRVDAASRVALTLAVAVTLAMGLMPNGFLDLAHRATLLFS